MVTIKSFATAFITLTFLLVFTTPALATRPAFDTLGTCDIEGTIRSATFEEAYEHPCVQTRDCPVGAFVSAKPARYVLRVSVESLSCTRGEDDNPSTYESQFPVGEEKELILYQRDVARDDQFLPGEKIRGTVEHEAYAHVFRSYELGESVGPSEDSGSISGRIVYIATAVLVLLVIIALFLFTKRRNESTTGDSNIPHAN